MKLIPVMQRYPYLKESKKILRSAKRRESRLILGSTAKLKAGFRKLWEFGHRTVVRMGWLRKLSCLLEKPLIDMAILEEVLYLLLVCLLLRGFAFVL
ncbi:hypothetical protein AU512_16735 [Lonsdalea iberica]|uniref:Uncharacterized protein n=1 Tax=Lonsdalea iberica TaxID=1082703 RepID=A0ABX3XCI2_9GAMM|nr:hypothetical protein AU512_16735 [Lonsdalea iberica]